MEQATLNMIESIFKIQKQYRLAAFHHLNAHAKKNETVFAGSSLMENFPISELLTDAGLPYVVYNRGIGATVSAELLANIDVQILDLEPSKLFINIGSNDLSLPGDYMADLIRNYRAILEAVRQRLPQCKIYILAYFPVANIAAPEANVRSKEAVDQANARVRELAAEMGCEFIDVNDLLVDESGYLRKEYAADQVHILPNAYHAILQRLIPFLR